VTLWRLWARPSLTSLEGVMRVLSPVQLTLGGHRCSLTVVDSHPDTQGTLWQAGPLHAYTCKVALGRWLHVWRAPEEDSNGNPMPTTSKVSTRAECGATRVMETARLWRTEPSILVASHRQVESWYQLAQQEQHGSGKEWLQALSPEQRTKHLSGLGVLVCTDSSSSPTCQATTCPAMAGQLQCLTESMASPGWLLAYLLHWACKRIRPEPRQHAYEALCALLGLCTSGHLQWASAGGTTQLQDGRVIDWGPYIVVAELLPQLSALDQAWLDCRPPWCISTALWATAAALLAYTHRKRRMSSTHHLVLANFMDWAVGHISQSMNLWARERREPVRDIDQLVAVRRTRQRTRLPADLLFRLAERKHPRNTLKEWQESGLVGGCNAGKLIQHWNLAYQCKVERVMAKALTLNVTLDATQAGGNSLEVAVVWGVEVQKAVYAPPQACQGGPQQTSATQNLARTEGASLQAGTGRQTQQQAGVAD